MPLWWALQTLPLRSCTPMWWRCVITCWTTTYSECVCTCVYVCVRVSVIACVLVFERMQRRRLDLRARSAHKPVIQRMYVHEYV
jgi:hypothetical protein